MGVAACGLASPCGALGARSRCGGCLRLPLLCGGRYSPSPSGGRAVGAAMRTWDGGPGVPRTARLCRRGAVPGVRARCCLLPRLLR
eukprot:13324397-Alexandrium_andersonii.AAC.1